MTKTPQLPDEEAELAEVRRRLERARARLRPFISDEEGKLMLEELLEERRRAAARE